MKNNFISKSKEDTDFQEIIKDIVENSEVQKMKNYKIHGNTTCFAHCYTVAYFCYLVCKKRNLDYKSAARAGMLHDFYLYDWRIKNSHIRPHAFTHPMAAYLNAKKYFDLNWTEKDMILTHMFPITLLTIPLCREGWILTLVDKSCATAEFFNSIKLKLSSKVFNN